MFENNISKEFCQQIDKNSIIIHQQSPSEAGNKMRKRYVFILVGQQKKCKDLFPTGYCFFFLFFFFFADGIFIFVISFGIYTIYS